MGISTRNNQSLSPPLLLLAALSLAIFTAACGGNGGESTNASHYPTGISEDLDQVLKYDARVQDSREEGDKLVVTVNEAWMSQPQGLQERAMGHWFALWKTSHGDKGKIVVEYGGDEVGSYTADKGFQPAPKKEPETESES
jgi:hypothetical protein